MIHSVVHVTIIILIIIIIIIILLIIITKVNATWFVHLGSVISHVRITAVLPPKKEFSCHRDGHTITLSKVTIASAKRGMQSFCFADNHMTVLL